MNDYRCLKSFSSPREVTTNQLNHFDAPAMLTSKARHNKKEPNERERQRDLFLLPGARFHLSSLSRLSLSPSLLRSSSTLSNLLPRAPLLDSRYFHGCSSSSSWSYVKVKSCLSL